MDIHDFEKWVYRNYSIDLSAYKSNQLHRRINSIMGRVGVKDFVEYTKLLQREPEQKERFLDFITINVTEFFRNPELYQELQKVIKEELLPKRTSLKAWSAACSIGAEPYSLAMIFDSLMPYGRHKILATDIDNTILQRGIKGEYQEGEIKNVSQAQLEKHFLKEKDRYTVEPRLKAMVSFVKHDLIHDDYEKDFDLICCRNVVIYFNNDIKNDIYKRFYAALRPGGILFVGATESIYNYKEFGFEKASTFIYRKI